MHSEMKWNGAKAWVWQTNKLKEMEIKKKYTQTNFNYTLDCIYARLWRNEIVGIGEIAIKRLNMKKYTKY